MTSMSGTSETDKIRSWKTDTNREWKMKSKKEACGPGPVNLGGELTVRHSALLVVDDAHSCCYNLREHLLQTTDNNIDDKACCLLFFYCSMLMHSFQFKCSCSRLWIFGSFSIPSTCRTSLLAPDELLTDQVLLPLHSNLYNIKEYTHPNIGKVYLSGQNLHKTATQQYWTHAQYVNKSCLWK